MLYKKPTVEILEELLKDLQNCKVESFIVGYFCKTYGFTTSSLQQYCNDPLCGFCSEIHKVFKETYKNYLDNK